MCRLSWNLGASTSWNPYGLSRLLMWLLCFILFPSRISWTPSFSQNIVRGSATNRGTNKFWHTAKYFKCTSKYCRNFCPVVGNVWVISVCYQLSFFVFVPFSYVLIRIGMWFLFYILGVPTWKKKLERAGPGHLVILIRRGVNCKFNDNIIYYIILYYIILYYIILYYIILYYIILYYIILYYIILYYIILYMIRYDMI